MANPVLGGWQRCGRLGSRMQSRPNDALRPSWENAASKREPCFPRPCSSVPSSQRRHRNSPPRRGEGRSQTSWGDDIGAECGAYGMGDDGLHQESSHSGRSEPDASAPMRDPFERAPPRVPRSSPADSVSNSGMRVRIKPHARRRHFLREVEPTHRNCPIAYPRLPLEEISAA